MAPIRCIIPGQQPEITMSDSANSDNPYTQGIAEFVSGLTYDAVPDEVRTRIKLLILDALGCGLYAADLPWSRILMETLAAGNELC